MDDTAPPSDDVGLPWRAPLAGRLDEHVIDSPALAGNPLGDPHRRPLWVYVPPGYDGDPGRRYPAVYVIQGFTGHLGMWRNRSRSASRSWRRRTRPWPRAPARR